MGEKGVAKLPQLMERLFNGEKILKDKPLSGELPNTKELLGHTLAIAWPSMLESFFMSLVLLVDTMMVGVLGAYAITAVGLTNQPKYIGLCFFTSLNTAVSALVARRTGEDNREAANRILKQSLLITLAITLVVSVVAVSFADPILRFMGTDEETHAPASAYLRIIMGTIVFNTVSLVINAAQRGSGNTKIALRTNLVSNAVNIVFNYLLIGGNFGFPRLEVAGAAVATAIGAFAAMCMSIYSVARPGGYLCLGFTGGLRLQRTTLSSIAGISASTLVEQLFMRFGFLITAVVVARLGTMVFAAHQIGLNLTTLAFAMGDGLSVASVALVGQNLGAGRKDLAFIYGHICQRVGLICAAGVSMLFLFFGPALFYLFSREPEILAYGRIVTYVASVTVFLQITCVVFSGCLRGAGDVRYVAMVSLLSVSFVRPLSSYLLSMTMGLGILGAWLALGLDLSIRTCFIFSRFAKGKWVDIKI